MHQATPLVQRDNQLTITIEHHAFAAPGRQAERELSTEPQRDGAVESAEPAASLHRHPTAVYLACLTPVLGYLSHSSGSSRASDFVRPKRRACTIYSQRSPKAASSTRRSAAPAPVPLAAPPVLHTEPAST